MAALTIEQQLAEAQSAYHQLVTGTMPRVIVDQNGERIEYTATNKTALYTYIQQLKGQVACAAGGICLPPTIGPAGFIF